jgi:hypothetical protein
MIAYSIRYCVVQPNRSFGSGLHACCARVDMRDGTHLLGPGLKYLEQWFSGQMYCAIMMLNTDTSSLGHGGGDLCLDHHTPAPLLTLIQPIIGRWSRYPVEFIGDYTKINEHQIDDSWTNIEREVATAVIAAIAGDLLHVPDSEQSAKENIQTLYTHLRERFCPYEHWQTHAPTQDVVRAYMLQLNDTRKRDTDANTGIFTKKQKAEQHSL